MEIHTIGFTQRSAAEFFEALKTVGVKRLIDVRLNNLSQLAGFAKSRDLEFFLRELVDADYIHEPLLAPDSDMLKSYRSSEISWEVFEDRFLALLEERRVESAVYWHSLLDRPVVLLCSERTPENCHRRLIVEYLNEHGLELTAVHL